jgi:hypothetical protein
MTRCVLDDQDKAALRALEDFTISADGETAMVGGEMEVVVTRPVDDDGTRFLLTIRFPGGQTLDVRIARVQLLEQLDGRSGCCGGRDRAAGDSG